MEEDIGRPSFSVILLVLPALGYEKPAVPR